jgi:hypothetical protein
MRITTAVLVLIDLLVRSSDLKAHYSDEGLWPSALIYNFGWSPGYWSLHALNGSYTWQVLLFLLHTGFAVGLLVGYRTRLFSLLTWLLMISLHNRNMFVLQAGDDLIRLLLLWGVFLPWNAYYSFDAMHKRGKPRQNTLANIGYLLLIASVYFFSANHKNSPQWHEEGSAVYYALSLEQLRLPLGDWLYQFPTLLKVITWLVLRIEYLIAPLVLFPSRTGISRFIAFVLLLVLHLGIGFTLYVGLFFVICIATISGLLPSFVMDHLGRVIKPVSDNSRHRPLPTIRQAISSTFCTALIVVSLLINLSTTSWFPYELRDEFAYPSNALRLNQYWGMFSPGVLQKDGWFVLHGQDSLGRQWDIRRNEDHVDYSKPESIVSMYKNDRWRKLAENMQNDRYSFLRPLYCRYMLRNWNEDHPEKQLSSLSVYFMEKMNLPDYHSTEPHQTLHCVCYND